MRRSSLKNRFKSLNKQRMKTIAACFALLLFIPIAAHASPFDQGINNVETLFTGVVAKAVSIIAVILGGLGFAFGDPGAKKGLAMTAIGVGVALLAVQVISWLWAA